MDTRADNSPRKQTKARRDDERGLVLFDNHDGSIHTRCSRGKLDDKGSTCHTSPLCSTGELNKPQHKRAAMHTQAKETNTRHGRHFSVLRSGVLMWSWAAIRHCRRMQARKD